MVCMLCGSCFIWLWPCYSKMNRKVKMKRNYSAYSAGALRMKRRNKIWRKPKYNSSMRLFSEGQERKKEKDRRNEIRFWFFFFLLEWCDKLSNWLLCRWQLIFVSFLYFSFRRSICASFSLNHFHAKWWRRVGRGCIGNKIEEGGRAGGRKIRNTRWIISTIIRSCFIIILRFFFFSLFLNVILINDE